MSLPDLPSAEVIENDPRDLRIEEFGDEVVYHWSTDQGIDPVLQKAQDLHLDGMVLTDKADYQTLADAVEDDALDEASNFIVYGRDRSVSWYASDGGNSGKIELSDGRNEDTELVESFYQATTGGKLESVTIEEIRSALGAN